MGAPLPPGQASLRLAARCRASLLCLSCLLTGVAPARDSSGTTAAQQQQAGAGSITSLAVWSARQNGLFCTTRTGGDSAVLG